MRDPYQVLGLTKSASAAEIKSTFRKLAKKYHPDQSKDPKAKEKFSELNSAYEIIGDEKKRQAFDKGEIDAEGKPRFQGFEGFGPGAGRGRAAPGGGGGFEHFSFDFGGGDRGGGLDPDTLAEILGGRGFRGRAPARGDDVSVTATIPLELIATGGSARVTLPTGKTLDVTIPAGIEEGKTIRLRGQGQVGSGATGDALVSIRYEPHPLFKVEGRDLRVELPVTLYDAVLGGKARAPTLGGEVEVTIPRGANSGQTLRLRGKGLPATGELRQGDILATLRIILPSGGRADLEDLMRRWRAESPYDVRSTT
jgi:DnaJ-class molecular chaperone